MFKRILLTAIVTITAAAANASTLDQAFDRTFDVRPGAIFSLTNTNGHITVRAWNQPRIRVHAIKHVESRDSDAARDAMKALTFDLSQPNGGLRIDAANTNGSIESDLPITTSGAQNKHSLHGTMNGGGPELRLRTTNGSIHIEAM